MAIEYYLKLHSLISLSTDSCQKLFQNSNSLKELNLKIVIMLDNNSSVPTRRITEYFFKALGI